MGRIHLERERPRNRWRSGGVLAAGALWFLAMFVARERGEPMRAAAYALGPTAFAATCLWLWLRDRHDHALVPLAIWSYLGLPFGVGSLLAAAGALLWQARELPEPLWWRLARLAAALWSVVTVVRLGSRRRGIHHGNMSAHRVT